MNIPAVNFFSLAAQIISVFFLKEQLQRPLVTRHRRWHECSPDLCDPFPGHLCIICTAIHASQARLGPPNLSEILHVTALNVFMALAAHKNRALALLSTADLGSASEPCLLTVDISFR